MLTIDLNADLGEGCPWDAALLERVTSASICCGGHAGGDREILDTLRELKRQDRGVVIGAHPGYPDRASFGRREREIDRDEVGTLVSQQVAHLVRVADHEGLTPFYVKPHGALYNQAQTTEAIAQGVCDALIECKSLNLRLMGQPASTMERVALDRGIRFIPEGFADRGYRPDGRLIPRGEPGAVLTDHHAIADQAVRLIESGSIRSLCLHGDSEGSVALADLILNTCAARGIVVRNFLS